MCTDAAGTFVRVWLVALALACPAAAFAAPLAVGERFPALAEYPLEGKLPDTAGASVVIVDFWASWCAPCRAAFPVLDELQREYRERGVIVVAVSVDRNRAAMEAFLKRHPVSFSIVRDAQMALVAQVDVPTMPTTFVLDRAGVVRAVHAGFRGDETRRRLHDEIRQLLEDPS